jgi:hypothetical protein
VTDQHGLIDERVVEDTRDVVGEILDGDALRIPRCRRAAVSSIMRMQPKPIGQVLAKIPPDVPITTDSIAEEDGRYAWTATLSPRLVK